MEGQEFLEWLGRVMVCEHHRLVTVRTYRRWWSLRRDMRVFACADCGVAVPEPEVRDPVVAVTGGCDLLVTCAVAAAILLFGPWVWRRL